MRSLIVACLLGLVLALPSVAAGLDDNPEAAALYQQAESALRSENWQEARRLTEELATRFADSPHRDLFLFEHAKATYHAKITRPPRLKSPSF